MVVVVASVFWLVWINLTHRPNPAHFLDTLPLPSLVSLNLQDRNFAPEISGPVDVLNLKLKLSEGTLQISDHSVLPGVRMHTKLPARTTPQFGYSQVGSTASAQLTVSSFWADPSSLISTDIGTVNKQAVITIDQSVGTQNIQISSAPVTSLHSHLDIGSMALTLESDATASANYNLSIKMGEIVITIPKEFGIKCSYSTHIGSTQVSTNNFSGTGVYKSPNFDQAATKITITASNQVGSILLQVK
jgi:hypothetical protein